MASTPQRSGSEGPLCHSTPKSEEVEESKRVGQVTSLPVSTHGWYRVLVFSKDHLGVNRVLRSIRRKITPLKLKPHYLHSGGEFDAAEDAGALFTFYVNGYAVASALFRLDRLNSRLWLRVNHRMPVIQYDAAHKRALKQAIMARYDPRKRSLDLTLFHYDGILQGMFFALANPHCMSSVLGILAREMPELEHLWLDRNHLSHLQPFWHVERRLPRLQSISIENNDLNSVALLRVLQFLPLVDLNLRRNLLPPGYEIDVLYMWPRLQKLNEVILPPGIGIHLRRHCAPVLIQKVSQETGMNWEWSSKF
ncbi:hypothetical protein KR059_004480, partial [Drosophila kikkawai]